MFCSKSSSTYLLKISIFELFFFVTIVFYNRIFCSHIFVITSLNHISNHILNHIFVSPIIFHQTHFLPSLHQTDSVELSIQMSFLFPDMLITTPREMTLKLDRRGEFNPANVTSKILTTRPMFAHMDSVHSLVFKQNLTFFASVVIDFSGRMEHEVFGEASSILYSVHFGRSLLIVSGFGVA